MANSKGLKGYLPRHLPWRRGKAPSPVTWAALFAVLVGLWAVTGTIKGGASGENAGTSVAERMAEGGDPAANSADKASDDAPFQVRTADFSVRDYPATLVVRGRTFADNQIEVRAETAGAISALPVDKGQFVKKGALLCALEPGAREANLLEAAAAVAQAEGDYKASQTLVKRGHTASLRVLQNKAALDRAKAAKARMELDLERTKITAPFDGFVDEQPAKLGSYLAVGASCAKLVALDPLKVIGAVRERDVKKLKPGQTGKARLVTGEERQGVIRFISATAETETRTFRMELEIPNPDGALKSGVTTDIEIPLAPKKGMLLPPSILTLDDKGVVGVRAVNGQKQVEFWPVEILSERPEGIWVEALPTEGSVITVGQDFVKPGQVVTPVPDPKYGGNKPGS